MISREELERLHYAEKRSVVEIARKYHKAPVTIRYWFKKCNLKWRPKSEAMIVWWDKRPPRELLEQLYKYVSMRDASSTLNCNLKTLNDWLIIYDIDRREISVGTRMSYLRRNGIELNGNVYKFHLAIEDNRVEIKWYDAKTWLVVPRILEFELGREYLGLVESLSSHS